MKTQVFVSFNIYNVYQRRCGILWPAVQGPCTCSTRVMYSQYGAHVLVVQSLCTDVANEIYRCRLVCMFSFLSIFVVVMDKTFPLLRRLPSGIAVPLELNDPFDYEPDVSALAAWDDLRGDIAGRSEWAEEIGRGKMFGVLVVVDAEGRPGYLAAYSGQIGGRCDWQGFVPAVFDYLQPDGHFKTTEAEISALNEQISQLCNDKDYLSLRDRLLRLESEGQQ